MAVLKCNGESFEFEDRLLAHLKFVIGQKLRRGESFMLSWTHAPEAGSGRSAIWLSPASALSFHFAGSRPPALNQHWLETMMAASHSVRGLDLAETSEPTGHREDTAG